MYWFLQPQSIAGPRLSGWVNPFNIELVGCYRSCSGARLPPDKLSTLVCFQLLWASDPAKMGADFWLPVSIRFSITRSFSCSHLHGCCHFSYVHGGSPGALSLLRSANRIPAAFWAGSGFFFFFQVGYVDFLLLHADRSWEISSWVISTCFWPARAVVWWSSCGEETS
jgi:hypothetical protein